MVSICGQSAVKNVTIKALSCYACNYFPASHLQSTNLCGPQVQCPNIEVDPVKVKRQMG